MSTIIGDIVTIGSSSSSDGEIFSLIKVTYPTGSTCTATNGTITLTAADTSGNTIFCIPEPISVPETWTVSCTNGTDSASMILSIGISEYGQVKIVILNYYPTVLNNATWEQISEISQAGMGDAYWDVGDCKAITLNGNIGSYLSLSNYTIYIYIIDFNHSDDGVSSNNIIWSGFKTALTNGTDVDLVDSVNGSSYGDGKKCFNMNHWGSTSSSPYNTNYGGWAACDIRYDILGGTSTAPSGYGSVKATSAVGYDATASTISSPVSNTFMSALPSDLRNALRLRTHYVDNKGNSSNSSENVTAIVDAISLLCEYEVYGTRNKANTYEKNKQSQMAYYKNGNPKLKYKHNSTSTSLGWYLASPSADNNNYFCVTNNSGNSSHYYSYRSYGLVPCFMT